MSNWFAWLDYGFMKNALIAILIITPLFGLMGTMIVNKKMAYFSDALGHSALTGIAVGVVCGMQDTNLSMVLFAIVFALLLNKIGSAGIATDTIISVFSSCSVAIGLAILSKGGNFSKYSSILVGDVLSITRREIFYLVAIFVVTIVFWVLCFNWLNAVCIHRALAGSKQIPVRLMDNIGGIDRNAFHQMGRYSDYQCATYSSGGFEPEYLGKYAGVSSVFRNLFRIFRCGGTCAVLLYECGDRPDHCNYCFRDLFHDLFFREKVQRIKFR